MSGTLNALWEAGAIEVKPLPRKSERLITPFPDPEGKHPNSWESEFLENSLKSSTGDLVKVHFELPDGSPYGAESLWAEKIVEGKFRLDNSPFYIYGYSYNDIVMAREEEGAWVVQGPCLRGGHSTYRIFLSEGLQVQSPEYKTYWRRLERLGCTYEGATKRLIAIDESPSADVSAVYLILEEGENAGIWKFEEGHCGHPVAHA